MRVPETYYLIFIYTAEGGKLHNCHHHIRAHLSW